VCGLNSADDFITNTFKQAFGITSTGRTWR
jgi:hypothetical protein